MSVQEARPQEVKGAGQRREKPTNHRLRGNTVHSGNSAVILGQYHKQQQQHTSQLPAA